MISRRYIEEWRQVTPWPENFQVEQDLVIERAIVEIFSDKFLNDNLTFRGGTALHKLFLKPQSRYSEDIDLVQIKEGPIKPILVRLREVLSFLGTVRTVKQKANNNTIVYRFDSEIPPVINLRLKIEINCREHFNVLGLHQIPFKVENSWFTGECKINTYHLEELLGTKMRALYQRTKGRDLFDLDYSLRNADVDAEKSVKCYKEYMAFSVKHPPSYKQYIANMDEKMLDEEFTKDIFSLLRPGIEYNNDKAYEMVSKNLLENI